MNIESFKRHNASRKPQPIPLRAKKKEFALPEPYTACEKPNQTVRLDSCRVSHINFNKPTQTLIVDLNEPEKFKAWLKQVYNIEREFSDVKLSRFKRAFGGILNPHIRIWSLQNGTYGQIVKNIQPGDTIQCAFTPRVSKGKVYFDLHRDIVLVKQHETKKYAYFSDED